MIRLNQLGLKCYGIDLDKRKINLLKRKETYNNFFKKEFVSKLKTKAVFSSVIKILVRAMIIICLPTPIKNKDPDMTSINHANNSIQPYLKKGQMLILESTTYPGTIDEIFGENYLKNLI